MLAQPIIGLGLPDVRFHGGFAAKDCRSEATEGEHQIVGVRRSNDGHVHNF